MGHTSRGRAIAVAADGFGHWLLQKQLPDSDFTVPQMQEVAVAFKQILREMLPAPPVPPRDHADLAQANQRVDNFLTRWKALHAALPKFQAAAAAQGDCGCGDGDCQTCYPHNQRSPNPAAFRG